MVLVAFAPRDKPTRRPKEIAVNWSPRLKIVVIGAGVAGCVLSKCLDAEDRIDLTCLEQVDRHHQPEFLRKLRMLYADF
jgi:choline dehydrogenase-like flavoprotein